MFDALYTILRKFGQMLSMIKISKHSFVENKVDGIVFIVILLVIDVIVWMEVAISDSLQNVAVTDAMRSYHTSLQ